MRQSSKIFAVIGFIAAVLVVGIAVAWFATPPSHTGSQQNPDVSANGSSGQGSIADSGTGSNFAQKSIPPHFANSNSSFPRPPQVGTSSGTATNLIPDWENRIDAILTGDGEDADKAKKMLEMFPQLAPDAQEEVAHHLSNLTPDENYAPLGNLLTNSALPEAVLDVFMQDVLNRPNGVKLPLLLQVARDSQHPQAGEAKEVMELFLEDNYGSDWSKWQARMDQWLKDNPD